MNKAVYSLIDASRSFYVNYGTELTREKEGLDHDHYVKNLQVPDYTIFKTHMDELLSVEGQKLFRSIAAKICIKCFL